MEVSITRRACHLKSGSGLMSRRMASPSTSPCSAVIAVSISVAGPPPPRGESVDSVMSPQLALCEVGSRGSSQGGSRRTEVASREPGWILLRGPGIAQAGLGPCPSGRAPATGWPPPGTNARPAPVRESARGRRGSGPCPAPPQPGPRARHLTSIFHGGGGVGSVAWSSGFRVRLRGWGRRGGAGVRRAWWGAVVGVGGSRGSGGVLRGGWARQGAGRVWRRPMPWSRRRVQGWSAL